MNELILTVVTISLTSLGNTTAASVAPPVAGEVASLAQLLHDLGSADWQVQRDAAVELGEQDPGNLGAVIRLLKDKNPSARRGACEAITSITRRMPQRTKEDAAKKLAMVRPAIGPVIELLASDPDDWTRTVAAETLTGLSAQACAVSGDELKRVVLRVLLDNDEDVWVRRTVYKLFNARDLPKGDLDKQTVIAIHLNASRFMDIMFRGGSMKALADMGPEAASAVPAMVEYAEDFYRTGKDNRRGTYAIRALGAIGAPAKPGLPILRQLAKDGPQGVAAKFKPGADENIKRDAATAIEQIEVALKDIGQSNQ